MKRLLIIGAGGHGAVVAEAAALTGKWEEIEFLDDRLAGSDVVGFRVSASGSDIHAYDRSKYQVIVAVGDNNRRLEIFDEVRAGEFKVATVIHPKAVVSNSASVEEGSAICAGAVVNARTTVGRGCIINTGATVDHDCILEDGVHVSPGANLAGQVRIGRCSWIGIGSAIREGITVGSRTIIAAGSAVIADVGSDRIVGGVPAGELDRKGQSSRKRQK